MAESFFAICLVAIILSVLANVKNQKTMETLNTAIVTFSKQGERIEEMIRSQYNVSIEDAISHLKKAKAGFLAMILYFTSNLD